MIWRKLMAQKTLSKEELQADYLSHKPRADAFLGEFLHQFLPLVAAKHVKLGVPLEGRVKDWGSIAEKLDRKELKLCSCHDLPDLIGVRAITLFSRDEDALCKLIEKSLVIQKQEDKGASLPAASFGYSSKHFIVKIPKAWSRVPAFANLNYTVEIQVRTLSQHIWAASSHLLQYKKEQDVPPTVARSIHRVAALLELVDLEFERVLKEREAYSKSQTSSSIESMLDADNLRDFLNDALPAKNKIDTEPYSDLLSDLLAFKVTTVGALQALIERHRDAVYRDEAETVASKRNQDKPVGTTKARTDAGVFYTHVGLTRTALGLEFGKRWNDYNAAKRSTAELADFDEP